MLDIGMAQRTKKEGKQASLCSHQLVFYFQSEKLILGFLLKGTMPQTNTLVTKIT